MELTLVTSGRLRLQLRGAETKTGTFAYCFTFRFWPHVARGQLVRGGHCIGNNHILEFQMYGMLPYS